jgi:hypothetical protein
MSILVLYIWDQDVASSYNKISAKLRELRMLTIDEFHKENILYI